MGCTVRDKHIRTNRRTRSSKPETDPCCLLDKAPIPKPVIESSLTNPVKESNSQNPSMPPNPNPSPNSRGPISGYDESGWGYCTEEQLEEILMKNLEFLYNEAISRLVALGYDEDVALKAMLRNGHCYGGMDVLANILHNSLAYLNNGGVANPDDSEPVFGDLKQLEGYSLAGMVRLLQQFRPQLSNGDAMWCLLMSDLHVGRASTIEIPPLQTTPRNENSGGSGDTIAGMSPSLCRFHSGWGFGNGGCCEPLPPPQSNGYYSYASSNHHHNELALQREIECPKRFNLSPSMKSLLKRNVALFAAGFRANAKQCHPQADPGKSPPAAAEEALSSKLRDLSLDEGPDIPAGEEDQKDEAVLTLLRRVEELERHVKERKEWAHEKAMQAANKLSNDLKELKTLRMERDETQRLKKGKNGLEDSTVKRLSEMESALRKASGQVDRANSAVKRLEMENAEIRAEMEASKLSAAESVAACLEVAKREKKFLKRLLVWERQRVKLQEEIRDEREKISEVEQTLAHVNQCQKDAELKWKQQLKAKEQALAQVGEERHLKETVEANSKRKLEALRLKIEIDFQRHKDDLQRLEQELSRLKASSLHHPNHHHHPTNNTLNPVGPKPHGETIANLLRELDDLEESSEKEANADRECVVCSKDEVSVVFLPCAHQVLCASCGEDFRSKGKNTCPCCNTLIEQRIHVYGASS